MTFGNRPTENRCGKPLRYAPTSITNHAGIGLMKRKAVIGDGTAAPCLGSTSNSAAGTARASCRGQGACHCTAARWTTRVATTRGGASYRRAPRALGYMSSRALHGPCAQTPRPDRWGARQAAGMLHLGDHSEVRSTDPAPL